MSQKVNYIPKSGGLNESKLRTEYIGVRKRKTLVDSAVLVKYKIV